MLYVAGILIILSVIILYRLRSRSLISPEGLQEMVRERKVYIIDCRKTHKFEKGHIDGARNIPGCRVDALENLIPYADDVSVVLYGEGECHSHARRATSFLRKKGRLHTFLLDGGWKWYSAKMLADPEVRKILKASGLDPLEYQDFVAKHENELFHIDVSGEKLYNEGHMRGAINIPMSRFEDELDHIPKDKKIILSCQTGKNAGQAALFLRKHPDFLPENIYFLNATIEYKAAGRMVLIAN